MDRIIDEQGQLDVVIRNAGHMVLGPTEAFTVEQLAKRLRHQHAVDAAAKPRGPAAHARTPRRPSDLGGLKQQPRRHSALSGTILRRQSGRGREDARAFSYAAELARFGIDTTIVVPGAFTTGTNHYKDAGHPAD